MRTKVPVGASRFPRRLQESTPKRRTKVQRRAFAWEGQVRGVRALVRLPRPVGRPALRVRSTHPWAEPVAAHRAGVGSSSAWSDPRCTAVPRGSVLRAPAPGVASGASPACDRTPAAGTRGGSSPSPVGWVSFDVRRPGRHGPSVRRAEDCRDAVRSSCARPARRARRSPAGRSPRTDHQANRDRKPTVARTMAT